MKVSKWQPKYNLATIQNEHISVSTIVQDIHTARPAITAYLGARYSRSAKSMAEITEELLDKNTDAAQRLEAIFHGYGHKSVGDMANLFICIEHVPMIVQMRIFHRNSTYAGQARSTRYQDFEKPSYIDMPQKYKNTESYKLYHKIIMYWMQQYSEMKEETMQKVIKTYRIKTNDKKQLSVVKARSFDILRYFLPLGLDTSFAFSTSARTLSEYLGYLGASTFNIEQKLYKYLTELLIGNKELKKQGYIPEAETLIRHVEPNHTRQQSTQEILQSIEKHLTKATNRKDLTKPIDELFTINKTSDIEMQIVKHYLAIQHPLFDKFAIAKPKTLLRDISKIWSKYHNRLNLIGNIAQTGSILIEGFADLGVLKDLNRHRSLERYIPLYQDYINMEEELNRNEEELFALCDYLYTDKLKSLLSEYRHRFIGGYTLIKKWIQQAKQELPEDIFMEYTRYLLPHAHKTRYFFYGSVDDLQYILDLRTRNGGHIAYRNLVYKWGKALAKETPLFRNFADRIKKVNPSCRRQFMDRS